MNAISRVWWTFFTAFPVQRRLAIVGAALCGFFVSTGLAAQQDFWMLGPMMLFIFVAIPAAFAGPGVFRALSAPRMHQLLPRFRLRMLGAFGLLVVTVFASWVLFAWGPGFVDRVSGTAFGFASFMLYAAVWLVWPFIWLTVALLLLFLATGDWRWVVTIPVVVTVLTAVGEVGRTAVASAVLPWLTAAVIAWAAFAAWYLRVRTIGPVVFVPQTNAAGWVDFDGPLGRLPAIRGLLAAPLPQSSAPVRRIARVAFVVLVVPIILAALAPMLRLFPFTSFLLPFWFMALACGVAVRIVHRSRLLWLRIPGPRQAVRRVVERSLWRVWVISLAYLAVVATVYASPLVGATAADLVLGLALSAAAGLYGIYVALAAVRGLATQVCGVGLMGAAYLMLLSRAVPSPTIVVAITAAELVGALLLRALAVRRWETIDWLRVRPIAGVTGALQ